jgi:hypothetical protein
MFSAAANAASRCPFAVSPCSYSVRPSVHPSVTASHARLAPGAPLRSVQASRLRQWTARSSVQRNGILPRRRHGTDDEPTSRRRIVCLPRRANRLRLLRRRQRRTATAVMGFLIYKQRQQCLITLCRLVERPSSAVGLVDRLTDVGLSRRLSLRERASAHRAGEDTKGKVKRARSCARVRFSGRRLRAERFPAVGSSRSALLWSVVGAAGRCHAAANWNTCRPPSPL